LFVKAVDGARLGALWGRYGGAMTEPWTVEADAARLGRHHATEVGPGLALTRWDSKSGSYVAQRGPGASEAMRKGAS